MSRDPKALTKEMYLLWKKFDVKMKEAGIDYILTCTTRTALEQALLYAQGRTAPGNKVTWVKHSKHQDGTAFDICIVNNGKLCWDRDNKSWSRAGEIGASIGLQWGGYWHDRDFPHFELK
jgi:peptidoglycan L-alanyl-D-glutamate endopeptidase CwlK